MPILKRWTGDQRQTKQLTISTREMKREKEFPVLKNGSEFGVYSIPEIALLVRSGKLALTDSVRVDGRITPLSALPDVMALADVAKEGAGAASASAGGSRRRPKVDSARLPVYEGICHTVRSELESFLKPFQADPDASLGPQSIRVVDFFTRFTGLANVFTDNCCQKLVKIIRASSLVSTVCESSTPELAKRIRDMAFGRADRVLGRYIATVKKIQVVDGNIKGIQERLSEAQQAATENRNASRGLPSAKAAALPAEWATPERLDVEVSLLHHTKLAALTRIKEYLQELSALPEGLIAYACDKCFAAEADYDFQRELALEIKSVVHGKLMTALETFDRAAVLEKGDLDQQKSFLSVSQQQEVIHEHLEKMVEDRLEKKQQSERTFKRIVVAVILLSALSLAAVMFWIFRF